MPSKNKTRLRSREWFDIPNDPSSTAIHIERYTNFGISAKELRSGKPIIGIAQTGSDLVPCNRIHLDLAKKVREGIQQAGGVPIEFPVHPIQETGKRPTAFIDRNLQYLSLVEVLFGYPIDGVVLTIGCDKTTPALLMGAATVDIPAICLSAGSMLNGYWKHFGLEVAPEDLRSQAIEWSMTRGARNGRVAWQFIQDLAGRLGVRIK